MTTSFYEAVLPPDGPYCAVGISAAGRVFPTFHDSIAELEAQSAELTKSFLNAYFALATFTDIGEGRKADNAKQLKSFFVDLDCGEEKEYADKIEATTALREFLSDTGLPEPYVVDSGWGIHAYWPLDIAIDALDWGPLARQFKRLCIEKGLRIDRAVTADAARVLRMPGTMNMKREPVPVTVMAVGEIVPLSRITDILGTLPPDLTTVREDTADSMTSALAGGDYPPSSFARLVSRSLKGTGCAQIAYAVQNSKTLDFNLWRAVLSIAHRCTDGETAIHKVSEDYPRYDANETLKLAEGTKGPYTCSWYRDNSETHCTGCTQKCTSPIMLGVKIEEAPLLGDKYVVAQDVNPEKDTGAVHQPVEIEIPAYPKPYFRGVSGGVYVRSKDSEGDPIEVQVYQYDLYISRRVYHITQDGDGDGELVEVNHHMPNDGVRRFIAPVSALLAKDTMRSLLLKHGVVAINKELDGIMAYFAASIKNLQKLSGADVARNQMGWTPEGNSFVVGELEYTANAVRLAPASAATKSFVPKLTARGNLARWVEMVNFYNKPGMEGHALAVFAGFAAPLVKLFGGIEVRGATINLVSSKSGTGKTTAQMVANSIFGSPDELLLKLTDTSMSKMQWLGTLNSIAVTIDEATNIHDDALSEFIYEIPQGRGKHRMEAQYNRLRANHVSWATLVIMSSNSSLYDKLMRSKNTPDGELRRLLEFYIDRPSEVLKEESDRVFAALNDNYGLAGPVYIQYVMREMHKLQELYNAIQISVDNALGFDQSDRFYSRVLTLIFMGGKLAKTLGLHNIDVGRVFRYAMANMGAVKKDVLDAVSAEGAHSALEAISGFVNYNINNILVINSSRSGEALPTPVNTQFRGPLKMRYEPDTKELWIAAPALREYLVERQVDMRRLISILSKEKILKHDGMAVSKRLGAGALSTMDMGAVRCYCVDGTVAQIDVAPAPTIAAAA